VFVLLLYIAAVAAANIITAATTPAEIGPVGVTFILRDLVQRGYGKRVAYMAIGAGLLVSALCSLVLGDTLWIAVASLTAFAVSESLDTEVYSRLRARFSVRVAGSGVIASAADSVIFCVIGLGLSGIVPWHLLPNVMLGQFLVKSALQALAGVGIEIMRPAVADVR
jgi:uncharacterized PurR-regulated membrane protein YhhQ (DUF165 family)